MTVERARLPGPDSIELAYERLGDRAGPPVLLVMGLGMQMLGWPDDFCAALAGNGLQVIRFDNRDVGLSTHLHHAPRPDVMAAFSGDTSSASYRLSQMASDAVGLLDALAIDRAHVVGASMGGMIAQVIAIEHPDRVRSLTSIMSTTGNGDVGQPTERGISALMTPPPSSRQEAMDRAVSIAQTIGSPGFELDQAEVRERAARSYDRANDPDGVGRQLLAILASADRTQALRSLRVPTLVLHGGADPLVDASGGYATAEAIPGAELLVLPGMGHDLPSALWPQITGRIAGLVSRAEAQRL